MTSARVVARNTGFLAAGDLATKVASFAFYVVMARALGQRGFGDFTFALSLALLLAAFDTGVDPLVTRAIARRREEVHNYFWNAIAVKLAAGAVGTAIAVTVAVVGGYDVDVQATVAILSVAVVIELSVKTVSATFQGMDDMGPIAMTSVVQRFFTVAIAITAMALGAGLVPVAGCYLLGTLVAAWYAVTALFRRGTRPALRLSVARVRALTGASLVIAISGLLSTLLVRVDAVILSFLKDNVAVGLYGAAFRLLESIDFLSIAVVSAVSPTLTRLGRDTEPSLGQAFEAAAKVLVVLLLPIGVGFALFAAPVIRLVYGGDYGDAASALRLLGPAAVLGGFSYLAWYALVAQGRERTLPWIVGAVMLGNVVANLVFIPRYSFDAAAAITSASELTFALLLGLATIRLTGAVSVARIVTGPVVASAGMAAVGFALGQGWVALAAAVVTYPLLLLAVEHRLFPGDVELMLRSLRRRAPAT